METVTRELAAADYRSLADQVRRAGLLERRPGYYTGKIAVTATAYLIGWIAFLVVGNSWLTLLCAVSLAVLFTQVVFIGHDAGHNQISSSHRTNTFFGLVAGNLLTGVSLGWWVPKHNAHHAHPNEPGRDPDIGPGILAFTFTTGEARRRTGISRVISRRQAWLFVPLLVVEGIGLHITSADSLIRRRDCRAVIEGVFLLSNLVLYLAIVFTVLSPVKGVVFVAVQQGLFGFYLGASFAPNHKGMPVLTGDSNMSFVTRQVLTARNVRGGHLVDFLLGGLNHQIEHHLFPTMCRPNLARTETIVRAFCSDKGLPYCETGLVDSYRLALRHLSAVSREADHEEVVLEGV